MAWLRRSPVLLILAALAWLLGISVPYLRSALLPLQPLLAQRLGRRALLVAVFALLLSFCLGLLRQRTIGRYLCYGLLGATVAIVATILVAGGTLGAAATVAWLAALGWASGRRLLRALFRDEPGPHGATGAIFAIALAWGLGSHLVLLLALVGLLHRWPIALFLACLTGLLWRDFTELAPSALRLPRHLAAYCGRGRELWFRLPLLTLAIGWFLFVFVQALAPETQFDALVYHLALPQLYIEQGRFIATPYSMQSWFYLGADMDYLLAMLLGGQVAGKLVHFAFLLLTVAAIAAFGAQAFGRRSGLFAAALYASTPLVAWEGSTAYVDLALSCYCLLAIVAAHTWPQRRSLRWLCLAGAMSGFAISVKISALYLLLPLGAVVGAVALFARSQRRPQRLLPPVAFGLATLAFGLPWPLLRLAQTGNPVFPFYNDLFKSPDWPAGATVPLITTFGIGYSPGDLLRLPWALTFQSERFYEGLPGGVIGLSLLILPLLALRRPFSRAATLLLALLVPFGILWIDNGYQYLRFALPGLPLVCLLAGYALAGLRRFASPGARTIRPLANIVSVALLLCWIAANLPLALPLYWNIPERVPLRVALGRESQDAYLARVIPSYNAYRAIERLHPGDTIHILAIFEEFRLYAPGIVEPLWSPVLPPLANETQALAALREHGVTHLLINRPAVPASVRDLFLLQPAFLERYGELEYNARGIVVYRLRYPPTP